MAIRFDPGSGGNNNRGNNRGGGGGSGSNKAGIAILLAILFGLWKKPKLTLFLLACVGGGLAYWYYTDPEAFKQMMEDVGANDALKFTQGCSFDQEQYDQTMVFEPLAAASSKNSIPRKASLLRYAPRRQNQGEQGSCVGWASAYAARTILEAYVTDKDPNKVTFSPSFLYNQIAINRECQGSYTSEALQKMRDDGLLPFKEFSYDPNSCSKQPSNSQLREAERFKIRGYTRLTQSGNNYDVDLDAIRQNIAQGAPVVIAMKVPPSFHYVSSGGKWKTKYGEANRVDQYGGHAMCLIGYDDDAKEFEIMNSWGDDWGKNGVCKASYDDFATFCREAYGIHPHPKSKNVSESEFSVEFGLVNYETGKNIPLKRKRGALFATQSPIKKQTRFKIEVTNNIECYTYVFGKETTDESYVLFPYDEKSSPYCGITGTRYFPKRDQNLYPDDEGEKDYMAVVVTKEPIDYDELNDQINDARGTYTERIEDALGRDLIKDVKFSSGGNTISFNGDARGRNAVMMVFEISKN